MARNECPLQNECMNPTLVYLADIKNEKNDENNFYFGLTERLFKKCFSNHKT